MKKRSLAWKLTAAGFGGALCFSAAVYAADPSPAPIKSQTTNESPVNHEKNPMADTMSNKQAAAATPLNDAEIVHILNTVDENEIRAAKKAEKQKMDASAMAYAKMLGERHDAKEDATRKFAKPAGIRPAGTKSADQLPDK